MKNKVRRYVVHLNDNQIEFNTLQDVREFFLQFQSMVAKVTSYNNATKKELLNKYIFTVKGKKLTIKKI